MAFPSILSVTDTVASGATDHVYNMPATVAANDLLILVHAGRWAGATGAPSGWTQKWDTALVDGSFSCYVKKAAGSEGGSTVTLGTDDTDAACGRVWRIAAASWSQDIADVQVGTTATGLDTAPNPPSVTASWGSADNLYIAVAGYKADFTAINGYPTSYTTQSYFETQATDSGNETGLGSAYRNYASASDNPAAFSLSGSNNWAANTIVIKPAASPKGLIMLCGDGGFL